MDESHRKANETRKKNEAARRAKWAAEREALDTARKGLLRVLDDQNAAPAELLHAAELLIKLADP